MLDQPELTPEEAEQVTHVLERIVRAAFLQVDANRHTILDSTWYSTGDGYHIGVVAVRTNRHEPEAEDEWKAYMGVALGALLKGDEQYIAEWGAGLSPERAAGFFPRLNIDRYKPY